MGLRADSVGYRHSNNTQAKISEVYALSGVSLLGTGPNLAPPRGAAGGQIWNIFAVEARVEL